MNIHMKNYDLVILAGGKSTRIKKLLKNQPKPLAKFSNFFFLDYLLFSVSKFLFKKIYIIAGYKGHLIKKKYHNKLINMSKIHVIIEKKLKGTGGALSELKNKVKNNFFLVNGDTILNIDFFKLVKNIKKSFIGSIALVKNKNYKSNKKLSSLSINSKNSLIFSKKNSNLMNGGVYFFKKKFLKKIENKNLSLENEIIPKLIDKKKLTGKIFNNFFLDIGTPKNFFFAKKKIKNIFHKPAIFLDRDEVINHDKDYTYKINDLKIVKKTVKFLQKKRGYYIFVITNQSKIGRKKFRTNDFLLLQKKLQEKLYLKKVFIDDFEFCPHDPEVMKKKLRIKCNCRKPENSMIERVLKNWPIIREKSIFIGNNKIDKFAALKSRINYMSINNIK